MGVSNWPPADGWASTFGFDPREDTRDWQLSGALIAH
jgi:hypothetical protein